jgi:hypothetical protein
MSVQLGMVNFAPNTNLNCWSNIDVSGTSSLLVPLPSHGLSTTLIHSNRDRCRCLIHYGLGFQWTWPPRVYQDRRNNNRPLNS